MTPSSAKKAVLAKIVQPHPLPDIPESSRLTVHAAVSRFSVLYEKIRNAVDYREDHLLRKAAIVRIVKRQLALDGDPRSMGQQLVRELIAARYLPNGVLSETLCDGAADILAKYVVLRRLDVGSESHYEWLMGILAAELEEYLDDHGQDKAFTHFLYEQLAERITLNNGISEDERRIQVYIACHRSLIKGDDEMVGYKLVRAFYPAWMDPAMWIQSPAEIALDMVAIESRVKNTLRDSLAIKFQHAVKPWAISLNILRTALNENPTNAEALMSDEEALHAAIERIAEKRISESKTKLRRGTLRAIIYLFITKMLFALAMEIPSELLLYQELHRMSLAINIMFPPVLMFLVGLLIRPPGKENVKRILLGVDELLSEEGPKGREVRPAKKHGVVGRSFFGSAYLFAFLVTFGATFVLLEFLSFTWVSATIFIFFLCIVSFFAFRLRLLTREYVAVPRPDNVFTLLSDFFSLPILRAGRFLSETISRFNVFVFFFDFIFEAPFKIFLNILEEWSAFMKEKKEQLQ
ncbi:MAG: hypothetical protein AAB668_01735 [Patescibacteria group bacterium]